MRYATDTCHGYYSVLSVSIHWVFSLLLLVSLSGCQAGAQADLPGDWSYSDLRAYDPIDADLPSLDIVAIYTRTARTTLQIRLDFLDLQTEPSGDLYIAIDALPGGGATLPVQIESEIEWDVLLTLPEGEGIRATSAENHPITDLKFYSLRDPFADSLQVSLDLETLGVSPTMLGGECWLQVISAPDGSTRAADAAGPVSSNGTPPPRLPILLAFWDVFPAYTPAQALKRWDSAHAGTQGNRHGLKHLLAAADETGLPVTLLDLKNPTWLSALDSVGGLETLEKMFARGLVVLPDVIPSYSDQAELSLTPPDWVYTRWLEENLRLLQGFDLPGSSSLYAPNPSAALSSISPMLNQTKYRVVFTHANPPETPDTITAQVNSYRWMDKVILLLPGANQGLQETRPSQANEGGLSLETRRQIIQAAIQPSHPDDSLGDRIAPLILLGGDLARSAWGEPLAARNALRYIAAHPWMRPFQEIDLESLHPAAHFAQAFSTLQSQPPGQAYIPRDPQGQLIASGLSASAIQDALLAELVSLPEGPVSHLAWQAYFSLIGPSTLYTPDLPWLRLSYLGQVGQLSQAARWADGDELACKSFTVHVCQADLDWDGEDELVLYSDELFTVWEVRGGYLTYALFRDPNGVHLGIAPSSLFYVGLSDPSEWEPDRGVAGDPGLVRGAFSERSPGSLRVNWDTYAYDTGPGWITFHDPRGGYLKSASIRGGELLVEYSTQAPLTVQVPLVVDPWYRFSTGWSEQYTGGSEPGIARWGWVGGGWVNLATGAPVRLASFTDSLDVLQEPEDPNRAYPPGHYLPFGMALVEVAAEGKVQIWITFTP
jgi:hypothetical protein